VTTWVVLAFWDSDDEDASGMPKLKKPLFQMTVPPTRLPLSASVCSGFGRVPLKTLSLTADRGRP
jgi:hypothetical protein